MLYVMLSRAKYFVKVFTDDLETLERKTSVFTRKHGLSDYRVIPRAEGTKNARGEKADSEKSISKDIILDKAAANTTSTASTEDAAKAAFAAEISSRKKALAKILAAPITPPISEWKPMQKLPSISDFIRNSLRIASDDYNVLKFMRRSKFRGGLSGMVAHLKAYISKPKGKEIDYSGSAR